MEIAIDIDRVGKTMVTWSPSALTDGLVALQAIIANAILRKTVAAVE